MTASHREIIEHERSERRHAVSEEEIREHKRAVLAGEIAGSPHNDRRERSKRLTDMIVRSGANLIRTEVPHHEEI